MSQGNAKLLLELSTMESCEARAVTDAEHVAESVPPWCELILTMERQQRSLPIHLRRSDGELIIEVLHEALHPWSGKSKVGQLWDQLDDVMDRIMADIADEDDRGLALGLATAIAILIQPYAPDPNIDAVREEALERWEERN